MARVVDPNSGIAEILRKQGLLPPEADTPTDLPAAAATPAATTNSPIPGVDPFRLAQANDAYQRAVNSINQRRTSTLGQYGFRAKSFDDQGNAQDLEVDPTSMYGGYQQMLDQQAGDSMAAAESGAGRGFTGGLANQAEGRLRYQSGAQSYKLGSDLLSTLGGFRSEQLGAKTNYDNELWQSRLDAARLAIDNGDFTPVADGTTVTDLNDPSSPLAGTTNGSATDMSGNIVRPPASNNAARARSLAQKALAARSVALNKKYNLGIYKGGR